MKNCTGIKCIMQLGKVDPATCPAVGYCPQATPPTTNADYIRSMSDEELAAFCGKDVDACPPGHDSDKCIDELYAHGEGPYPSDKQCIECWLGWLKQEGE